MVAVLIVTYNAIPWIAKCWNVFTSYDEDITVIVIDNGSTDGTIEIINKQYPHILLIELNKNLGFGKANNIAICEALNKGYEHFLLLNQDATISIDSIKEMVKLQKENPEYGILSPLQMYDDTHVDNLHMKSLLKHSKSYFNDLICNKNIRSIYDLAYTNAAVWMVSKNCLRKVGGFDPLFPHYGEDVEYASRVTYCGMRVGLVPHVKAYHFRDQNRSGNYKSSTYYYNIFLIKVRDCSKPMILQLVKILSELSRSTIGRFFGIKGLANARSWNGFMKIIFNIRSIAYNRSRTAKVPYLFLEYEEA